jgi:phosphohistidine phosphatase
MADLERPLAPRGERDAALVGEFLGGAVGTAVRVVTSPARRAMTTAAIAAAAAGWKSEPVVDDRLYYGGVGPLLEALGEMAHEVVAAFGHEPVWSAAVASMVGGGSHHMVTAAAAGIDFPGHPAPGRGSLLWMVTPRSLGGGKPG